MQAHVQALLPTRSIYTVTRLAT